MIEKTIFLLLVYGTILIHDSYKWKQFTKRARMAYGTILLATCYLSLMYVFDTTWPNLDELINLFFLEPAKRIVEALKLPT